MNIMHVIFSIMNSLVIVLFLSGMVAMIMLRTLHKDIARYNQIDNSVSSMHSIHNRERSSVLFVPKAESFPHYENEF